MRALLVVLILGCGGGTAMVVPKSVVDNVVRDDGIAALLAANGNARALERRFATPLGFGGMWFPDPQCRAMFSTVGTIDAAHISVFAKCVATVELARSAREGALPNVGTVTYGPQVELELLFARDDGESRVKWLGYVSQQRPEDTLPTVTDQALEAMRVEPTALDATLREALDRDLAAHPKLKGQTAWLKVCIDEQGAVTSVRARLATSIAARDAFVADAKQWRFRPYLLGATPSAVCSVVAAEHPAGAYKHTTLPHPAPPSYADVTFIGLGGLPKQIAGEDPPPERFFALTRERGREGFDLSYLFCIDKTGSPVEVAILRSSGIPPIDQAFLSTLRGAAYEAPAEKVCVLRRHVQVFTTH